VGEALVARPADHRRCAYGLDRDAAVGGQTGENISAAARRPELCIGTDPVHTPEQLASGVEAVARGLGIEVARDTPFAGTFVPSAFLGDVRVRSVMLEVRRDTYMDEGSGALHDGAARVSELVRRVVEQVLGGVAGVT
jgi:N-formylglutamate amidohydrolase